MALKEHTGIAEAIRREYAEVAKRRMREHVLRSGFRYIAAAFLGDGEVM